MPMLATARSFLFVPGSDREKIRKALGSTADAVIADLEDAVAPAEKAAARAVVAEALASPSAALRLVRINAVGTAWHDDDVAWLSSLAVDGVVLPKASPETAATLSGLGLPVIAIVETADGLRRSYELASAEPVVALVLGAVDLSLALGLELRADGQHLLFARSRLVVDSAAAGIRGPIDQVWTNIRDEEGLERDCALGRSLGLRGKACIHPAQITAIHDAFSPTAAELARADAIVDAFDRALKAGTGAVALDGEMIDLPVAERARQLLADATRGVGDGS